MTDRIAELAEQAGLEFDDDEALEFGEEIYYITKKDMEKFAELIVRECADICINENVSNLDMDVIRESGKFTLQDLATKSCGENLSKLILRHFGI